MKKRRGELGEQGSGLENGSGLKDTNPDPIEMIRRSKRVSGFFL